MASTIEFDISNHSSFYIEKRSIATTALFSNSASISQLSSNNIYIQHFPNIIIGLSILYIACFLIGYSIRKFRRFRDKKRQQEKIRLRQVWTASIIKYQMKMKQNAIKNEEKDIEEKEETNTIAYPASIYKESTIYNISISSLNNPPSPGTICASSVNDEKSMCLFALNNNSKACCNTANSMSTTIEAALSKEYSASSTIVFNNTTIHKKLKEKQQRNSKSKLTEYPELTTYWKVSKAKRLSLLWQWSVSMGYMEYDHAKGLNDLVMQLCRKQEYGSDNDDEESEVSAAGEEKKTTVVNDGCCVVTIKDESLF